jgi:MFS family permease
MFTQVKVHPAARTHLAMHETRRAIRAPPPGGDLATATVSASTRAETTVVYAAGAVQGIVLVTFPAASTIFTDPDEYGLSNTQYGILFLPQVATAITASLLGSWFGRRFGTKQVCLAGLGCGLVSMLLLIVSQSFESNTSVAFPLLLVATAFLGAGFGLTVPALNTLTAAFHPAGVESSVLVLNALLGFGTVLAPVFVAIFVGLGFWWGLPLTSAILLTALVLVSLRLPLQTGDQAPARAAAAAAGIPDRFWMYAAFALLYGVCETMNGNWSQLDMTSRLGASTTGAAIALTAFWAMVTVGRIVFAAVDRWLAVDVTYHVLPFLLAGAFVLIAFLPHGATAAGVAAFALAGLGCSALLPLTIGFGEKELAAIAAALAGGVIAFYQLGYGIAAFGVGPLLDHGVKLSTIYGLTAVIAVVMGFASFGVTRAEPRSSGVERPA